MKLVVMAQMFNENTHKGFDGKTNIQRFMESISKYADGLVIYNDESFDKSADYVMSHEGKFQDLIVVDAETNDFEGELAHKSMCFEICRDIGATHVLWLDCDEVIEAKGERGGIRNLCNSMEKDAVNFFQKNLWRSDRFIRVDELWDQGLFCRLWKMTDELHFMPTRGLHQNPAPKGIVSIETSQLKVIHYGFSMCDNVLRKYYMYKTHGQKGWALDRLLDEKSLRIKPANPAWFVDKNWPYGPDEKVYRTTLRELL